MTSHEAFLKSIVDEPHEDAHRLVYADWLEDEGEAARAEFIRAQCYLARDERESYLTPEERFALKKREKELLDAHKTEWAGAAAKYYPEFRRGFAERVTLDMRNVAAGGRRLQRLREAVPTIAGLKVNALGRALSMPPSLLRDMLNHKACHGLRELDMTRVTIGSDGAQVVADAGHMALERLNLQGCGIGAEGMARLAASPHMAQLRELGLANNGIRLQSSLAEAAFPRLEALDLEHNALRDDEFSFIANAPFMRHLKRLELSYNPQLGDAPLMMPANRKQPIALRRFGVEGCNVSEIGVQALARSAQFAGLESLSLGRNPVYSLGALALAESAHLGKLQVLELPNTRIGINSIKTLVASRALRRLHSLDVSEIGPIWAVDLQAIVDCEEIARLRSLKLRRNRVSLKGLNILLACESLESLLELDISDNIIGHEGVRALAESTRLQALRNLSINDNQDKSSRLCFAGAADTRIGAVGPMTLGMRARLAKDHPQCVTVRE